MLSIPVVMKYSSILQCTSLEFINKPATWRKMTSADASQKCMAIESSLLVSSGIAVSARASRFESEIDRVILEMPLSKSLYFTTRENSL